MADFAEIVDEYYQPLYRFAISLTRREVDAADLVQQTFSLWARKGHQLRDESKVKTWLFTTLRREFLGKVRRESRYADEPVDSDDSLGAVEPEQVDKLDAADVMDALSELPAEYREPLVLFYLDGTSYAEIAEILEIPIGTVMSRLSRGKTKLRQKFIDARK